MMAEPEVHDTQTTPSEVTVTTTVVGPELTELSKRVDQTHDLVVGLDTRFESHRIRTDNRLDEISGGVSQILQTQAVQAGKNEAASEASTKRGQGIARRGNWVGALAAVATVVSTAAMILTATAVH